VMRLYSFERTIRITLGVRVAVVMCAVNLCSMPVSAQTTHHTVDQQTPKYIFNEISRIFTERYVYPDSGRKYGQKIGVWAESKDYDGIIDAKEFADLVTNDLQKMTHDKHVTFRVIESSDLGEEKEGSLHHPVRLFRINQNENYGLYKFEWLDDKVGYLDIRRFNTPSIARDMVVSAMNLLKNAQAVIIDIRKNRGGSTDILPLLCSYFFEYPTQLNSDYYSQYDLTIENWTEENDTGIRLINVPLYILTSRETFSAAESFAYDMKVWKRAVIIGDSTGGGAHSVDLFKIGDRFEMYMSTVRSFNPLTQSDWEGTGVIPDILVPAAFALDTALVLATKAAKVHEQTNESDMKKAIQEMQIQINQADSLYQLGNDDDAAELLDSAFQTGSNVNMLDEFFLQVLAYEYWSREDERMLVSVLKRYIDLFPNSYSAYETMAWAYMTHENKELAARYFEKVLKLKPDNSTAIQMLKQLK